jgi:hypothetical protein
MTDLRAALSAAVADRDAGRGALTSAQAAAERGGKLVASLEAELENVRDRGINATVHRTEEIVAALKAGDGKLPKGHEARLVDSITENRVAGELNAALAARVDVLRAQHEAEMALREAEGAAVRRAAAILVEESVALAADLVRAKQVVFELQDRLQGLANTHIPAIGDASPHPLPIPQEIVAALQMERPVLPGTLPMPIPAVHYTGLFTEYLSRLTADPLAEFEYRPPQPLPLPAHMRPPSGVVFGARGGVRAEREPAKRSAEAEANASAVPAAPASAIALARQRGHLPPQPQGAA